MFERLPRDTRRCANTSRRAGTVGVDVKMSGGILGLQRLAGNRATADLLHVQRQPVIEVEGILDPQQVTGAIFYYKQKPKRYTKEVINQIQVAVGTLPKDEMDAADVQAVAEWQRTKGSEFEPHLKVDGMAGPRTLPRMFQGGLGISARITVYVGEMKSILDKWDELKTPEARRLALKAEINKHLGEVGVPDVELTTGEGNQFDSTTWTIFIRASAFKELPADPAERERHTTALTSTLYHEARHAEQAFRIAAMLAGRGLTEGQIYWQTSTKKDVIKEALKPENQLKPGTMEAAIAEGWYDSQNGADSPKTHQVYAELNAAAKAFEAAEAAKEANPTPENQRRYEAAVERFKAAEAAYYDLPQENDAFRISDEIVMKFQALKKASKSPG
ncbi:hypothetical protein AFM11_33505 [Mycolicibacterium wolinskyi]|uniref:Uncharacterized protein n=1 Tax=Mycolicibacterium wolinskyi TaxID=59750 RepID=A0A132PC52_9MYCO|nr:hypothetical protein [Mycolicibacterium wolinskyi]KWX19898.1 hypothetical protein AFM11_33505 [Mycolicibacterium wolinskyi]